MHVLGNILILIVWFYGLFSLSRLGYIKSTPLRHKVVNHEAEHRAISLNDNARFIQEQEHKIWPDAVFEHVNCAVCGPGPLLQGTVPSEYDHPFFRKEMQTHDDGYGTWRVEALVASNGANAEMVSSAVIEDGEYTGKHTLMLDMDYPVTLMESTTTGHHHLYADRLMTWKQYRGVLKAMAEAGLIEDGYYRAALRQSATMLRPPWVKKTLPARPARPARPSPPPNASRWDRYRRGKENS